MTADLLAARWDPGEAGLAGVWEPGGWRSSTPRRAAGRSGRAWSGCRWTPLVCHRHRRWLGRDHEPAQHDLSAAPDILAASRRLAQVLTRSGDRAWAWKEFVRAWDLTRRQPEYAMKYMPAQEQRWRARAAAFGIPAFTGSGVTTIASAIVTFPEAVALAAITTDLSIRRHAALNWDAQPLYQRIGASLGESPRPG